MDQLKFKVSEDKVKNTLQSLNGNEYETIDVLEKEHKGGNANKKEEGKRDS